MTEEEKALARAQIRHLQSVYNNAGDRGKIVDLISVFAEDGVMETPGETHAGRQAIYDYLTNVAGAKLPDGIDMRGARHHLTTSRIEFPSEIEAEAWTYFLVTRRGMMLQEGLYVDRFVKQADSWLIAHRRVKMLWRHPDKPG